MKQVFRDMIPPFLLRWYRTRKFFHKYGTFGNFPTWEQAVNKIKAINKSKGTYDADVNILTKNYKQFIPDAYCLLSSGLLMSAIHKNTNDLRVLELGGGLGTCYFNNRYYLQNLKSIKWCILDLPQVIKKGKEEFESDELKFFNTAQEALSAFDLDTLVLNAVLSFIEKPYDVLRQLLEVGNFKFVLFDRIPLSPDDKEKIMADYHPPYWGGSAHPMRLLSSQKLFSVMETEYDLFSFYDYGPYPALYTNHRWHYLLLLFARKGLLPDRNIKYNRAS